MIPSSLFDVDSRRRELEDVYRNVSLFDDEKITADVCKCQILIGSYNSPSKTLILLLLYIVSGSTCNEFTRRIKKIALKYGAQYCRLQRVTVQFYKGLKKKIIITKNHYINHYYNIYIAVITAVWNDVVWNALPWMTSNISSKLVHNII